ncbi:MAG: calcium/sodium antiporter [Marinobacter sp.]|nr:calcium/sodium antiporter [Marinobacter sp.]
MLVPFLAILGGLLALVWSADKFVDGAAATARHAGLPTLLIGMVIIGFGTSAPELVVSALAASAGNPGLALGNAYGSNIANIALVIGLVALISPINVQSQIVRKELPLLLGLCLLAGWQLLNGQLSRLDGWVLLGVFAVVMGWTIRQGLRQGADSLGGDVDNALLNHPLPLPKALFWLVLGLILLVVSSRILVWGAVSVAQTLGVNELIIGLPIVAIGTSLPELASAIAAIRKNEHDLALGNVVGSGIFNTLAVVGIAATISPLSVEPEVLYRDWSLMTLLTLALLVMGLGWRGRQGRINRLEGGSLLLLYLAYTGYLASTILTA